MMCEAGPPTLWRPSCITLTGKLTMQAKDSCASQKLNGRTWVLIGERAPQKKKRDERGILWCCYSAIVQWCWGGRRRSGDNASIRSEFFYGCSFTVSGGNANSRGLSTLSSTTVPFLQSRFLGATGDRDRHFLLNCSKSIYPSTDFNMLLCCSLSSDCSRLIRSSIFDSHVITNISLLT